MRSHTAFLVALSALLPIAGLARADDIESYYLTEKLVEKTHEVDLTLHGGWADLVVRRSVFNGSDRSDQIGFKVELPSGAATVGLRTKGDIHGEVVWFQGEVLDSKTAALRYLELTGIGPHALRDPALLSWRDLGEIDLQVFPCKPGETKEVEYSLRMPASYADGAYRLSLPALGSSQVPAHVTLHGENGATVRVDGRSLSDGETILLDEGHDLAVSLPFSGSLRGEHAVVPIADEKALLAMHIDVAPRLSTLPLNASLVLLIDSSRSIGEASGRAELSAARAYLDNFDGTGAKVNIATFDRKLREVTHGFVTLDAARKALGALTLSEANGSNLDAALDHARSVFGSAPATSARRVVPVRKTFVPDEAHGKRWAGMLFGSALYESLKPTEMRRVASYGGAVSPVTSFLAVEPGVRPSVEGIARGILWGNEIGDSFGAGGLGLVGIGEGGEGGGGSAVDYLALLRQAFEPGVRACGAVKGRTTLRIETTSLEIVDVEAQSEGAGALRDCLEEAAWSAMLSEDFHERFARWNVTL